MLLGKIEHAEEIELDLRLSKFLDGKESQIICLRKSPLQRGKQVTDVTKFSVSLKRMLVCISKSDSKQLRAVNR